MTKAVISNRIYLTCERGSDLDKHIIKELTYEICQQPISPYPLIIRNAYRITDKVVSIPSGRLDLIPEEYQIVDKRTKIPVEFPDPKFTLRENQQEAVDYISGNGLINGRVGWGKTIVGLGLALKFKQKTLIITTTTTIREMWSKEIKKQLGITPGIIGGGKFETDPIICVGNIQTIRNRLDTLGSMFGMIICDEVHRCPASTFVDTLNSLKATHKIGLSGTLKRKDGKHCVLPDYFGTTVFVAKKENTIDPEVHLWDSTIQLNASEFRPWSLLINELTENSLYRSQILNLADAYADAGHKVLVVCDRTSLLEWGHEQTKDYSLMITGKVSDTGTRNRILEEMNALDSPAAILWATQSILSEGVSVSALSCVILGTPLNNDPLLEQIGGRVMRLMEGKQQPVIVDVALAGTTGKRQKNARKKFYISKGWKLDFKGAL